MDQKKFVGQRIRTMRLSRGMTQADLARAINQSQSSITMYENGRREPDFETLEALADVFNGPMVSFVDGGGVVSASGDSENFQICTTEARILAKGIDKLPQAQREQALAVIRAMFDKYAPYFEKENDDQ